MKKSTLLRICYGVAVTGTIGGLAGCSGSGASTLSFASTAQRMEPLLNGFHYEGWAIIDGAPRTFGKFNVDSTGNLVNLSGKRITSFELGSEFQRSTKLIITIEPNGDTDTIPAATHFLAGDVTGKTATLSLASSDALGTDFATAAGSYLLATPTATNPAANPLSGVWFLQMPGPTASLALPTLPAGWQYEGWAVIGGQAVSTGKFLTPGGADLNGGFSGPNPEPPFPGEDFLVNAPAGLTFPTSLAGAPIVVSVEPMPDDSPAPFSLKPLITTTPNPAMSGVSISLNNQAVATAPSMTVTLP